MTESAKNMLLPLAFWFWSIAVVCTIASRYNITSRLDRTMMIAPTVAFYLLCLWLVRK
jgi:hypothetical protein